jgi:hypothetical protein
MNDAAVQRNNPAGRRGGSGSGGGGGAQAEAGGPASAAMLHDEMMITLYNYSAESGFRTGLDDAARRGGERIEYIADFLNELRHALTDSGFYNGKQVAH